ncbi:MAG: hypothetical protein AMJ60_01890 [Desulfobacterales bacterium SG8_35]|nr:MAG: hypothetical protein AMJ60_01890 [Desulfobacterales bacterium SG8_35]
MKILLNDLQIPLYSFLLAQKRIKKGSQSLGFALRNFPPLLETTGSLKTRYAQTGQTPVSVVSVVLGCVKWQKLKRYILHILFEDPYKVRIKAPLLGVVVNFLKMVRS